MPRYNFGVILAVVMIVATCRAVQGAQWATPIPDCPCTAEYGPLRLFEKSAATVCALLNTVPPNVSSAIVQPIKVGCAQLEMTPSWGTLGDTYSMTTAWLQLANSSIAPTCLQGRAFKSQWDAASGDPQRQAFIQQLWSVLLNSTVNVTQAFLDHEYGPRISSMARLELGFDAVGSNFTASFEECEAKNGTYTHLLKQQECWEKKLKNCSTPSANSECQNATKQLAYVKGNLTALAPSVKFCSSYFPLFPQAYRSFTALTTQLSLLLGHLVLGYSSAQQGVVDIMKVSESLAIFMTKVHLSAALGFLSDINTGSVDPSRKMLCSVEAQPCHKE